MLTTKCSPDCARVSAGAVCCDGQCVASASQCRCDRIVKTLPYTGGLALKGVNVAIKNIEESVSDLESGNPAAAVLAVIDRLDATATDLGDVAANLTMFVLKIDQ
jgi:hypothetical protein